MAEGVSAQRSHPNPYIEERKIKMTREVDKLMQGFKFRTRRAARRHLQREWGYR